MIKNYELLYIVHPDLEGSTEKVTEKVAGFVNKIDGKVSNQEDWGKRKLAYSIGKNDFGVYILVNFAAESGLVPQVENNLKLTEEIMRFMVVALPEVTAKPRKAKKEVKPAEEKEVKAEVTETEAKPEKATKKEEVAPVEEVVEEKAVEVKAEKPKAVKSQKSKVEGKKDGKETVKKATKKVEKTGKAEEAERMKKLDEKLEQILGE